MPVADVQARACGRGCQGVGVFGALKAARSGELGKSETQPRAATGVQSRAQWLVGKGAGWMGTVEGRWAHIHPRLGRVRSQLGHLTVAHVADPQRYTGHESNRTLL